MSKWKEGQRRSPRISALDACKAHQSRHVPPHPQQKKTQGPASRTRARANKLRKLRPLQDVAATSLSPFAHQINQLPRVAIAQNMMIKRPPLVILNQLSSVPSTKWMPEKRILEHILDILQRKDTNEIFAEPVDPEEVENYYEIIKEPMDFGTMRAKLHEGMYISLQQFEHDVYLISRNATHFNSSATTYFRQVFHALKTDPENFELEFLETRRRTSRRLISEARVPSYSSSSKLATNLRPYSRTNMSSKTVPYFFHNSSNLRKSIRGIRGHSGAATDLNSRDHEVHFEHQLKTLLADLISDSIKGAVNGRRKSCAEVDRRCTYTPWMSLLTENDSIISTVYRDSEPLIPVNLQGIGYRDSLMFFVKDLRPTAQMIANRKLTGSLVDASNGRTPCSKHLSQEPECQYPNASTAESEILFDYLHKGPNISGNANYKVDAAYANLTRDQMLIPNALVEMASSSDERKIPVAFGGDEKSYVLRSGGQDITAHDDGEVSVSVGARQEFKASQPVQLGSQYIFDLAYL
ncbi:hypothetical protein REPUB_Repub20aG0001200 [Reevesia pubescens]